MLTGNSTLPIQNQLKSVLLRSFSILPSQLGITSNHVQLQKFWKLTQLGTAFFSIITTTTTITIVSLNSDIITVRVQNVNFKIPFSGFLKAITKLVGILKFVRSEYKCAKLVSRHSTVQLIHQISMSMNNIKFKDSFVWGDIHEMFLGYAGTITFPFLSFVF